MKKFVFSLTLLCVMCCYEMYAQTENVPIFTCDKNIPSYYVSKDDGDSFYRNERSQTKMTRLKEILQINSETSLVLADTLTDIAGGFHETYQEVYKGVEVDGKRCAVHYSNDGVMKMINGNLLTLDGVEVFPTKKKSEVKPLALEAIRAELRKKSGDAALRKPDSINLDSVLTFKESKLVIYIKDDIPYLVYKFTFNSFIVDLNKCVYIDANNGNVIDIHDTFCDISTTAQSVYSNIVPIETIYSSGKYRLHDTTRGNGIFTKAYSPYGGLDYTSGDNTWANLSTIDRAAIDVHWGVEKTYDFYLNKFGRNSYDNNGHTITSFVNVMNGSNYFSNAFWDGSYLNFGRYGTYYPIVSIDIVAHEYTHAVTSSTSNLAHNNESGAINEGLSDVFGACVEKNTKPNNPDSNIWKIGEDCVSGGLRDLSNPICKYYHGTGWSYSSNDNGGVHTNSGVFNYWFYLLVNGGSGLNEGSIYYSVDSIGFDKAIQICYLANAAYLMSNHQYKDARYCTLYAAQALNYSQNVINQVGNAWDAVGVYDIIVGYNYVFNTAEYSATVPDSLSVNWLLTGNNAANFVVQNNTPSHNDCRITRISNREFSGVTNLTLAAQIMHGSSIIYTATKQLNAPYIKGPKVPCGRTAYYVDPLPSNYTVEWTANGTNLEYDPDPSGLSPESPYAYVIIHNANEFHSGTLTATIKQGNSVRGTFQKTIDTSDGFSGTWYQQATLTDTINSTPTPFHHGSSFTFIPGRKVYLQSEHFVGANVTYTNNHLLVSGWSHNDSIISFTPLRMMQYVGFMTIEGTDLSGCKTFSLNFNTPIILSAPNLLSMTTKGSICEFSFLQEKESQHVSNSSAKEWRLTILKIDSGQKFFDETVGATKKAVNTSGWPSGIYAAVALIEDRTYSLKFTISE